MAEAEGRYLLKAPALLACFMLAEVTVTAVSGSPARPVSPMQILRDHEPAVTGRGFLRSAGHVRLAKLTAFGLVRVKSTNMPT